jgi:hypothetical protein
MSDEPATVPDFLPLELEQEYLADAHQQVQASHELHQELAPPQRVSLLQRLRPHRHLSWLPPDQVTSVMAAMVLGLLGLIALTAWCGWLAITANAMWWGYTGLGVVLLAAASWVTVAVNSHRQRCAARRAPAPEPAAQA